MSSVSSISSSSTKQNANQITGLASGMDVDELVDALSTSTLGQINKISQKIQKNEWKTDAYRELTSKLIDFSNKYLSFSSKDNMRSSSSYTSYSVTAKGSAASYLKVSTSSASGSNAASNMIIGGVSSVASAAYYSTGSTTKSEATMSGAIKEKYNVNNLKGETIGFKINDGSTVTLKFESDNIKDAVEELNKKFGDSGIKATYDEATKEFSIEADGDNKLSFSGVTNNIKNIFGLEASTVVDSSNKYTATIDESKVSEDKDVLEAVAGKTITLNFNGSSKAITISQADLKQYKNDNAATIADKDQLASNAMAYAIQKGADKAFGTGRVNVGVTDNNELKISTSSNTNTVSVSSADDVVKTAAGIKTGTSNRVSLSGKAVGDLELNTALDGGNDGKYKIKVNDVEISISKDDTTSTIMSKINSSGAGVTVSYSQTSNSFSFVANETGSMGRIEVSDVEGNLTQALFGGNIDIHNGTDTQLSVSFDGGHTFNDVTRSTASFSLDGVSLSLDKEIVGADFTKPISFTANNDSDKIVDKIKTMIEDYNSLITAVNDAVKTRPNSTYQPLTDAQKEEMTEKQIEKWEEKAKVGLLYGDSDLRSLQYELSRAVTNIVGDVGAASSIGLSLSSDYTKGGIIEIDEEKLKKAVDEDPDKVISMFTNSTSTSKGITERMKTVLDKYAGTSIKSNMSSRTRGILVNRAGVKDHLSATDNELNDELKALKEKLEKLQTKYDKQRERLFKRFSGLESFVSSQNSTSSWITAQLGY